MRRPDIKALIMKAYGYLRVSGKGQVKGDGLTRQEKAIRDYAKTNNIEIVNIFRDEGVSGTIADRPGLGEMIVSLALNGLDVKTIIVEKLDRLARDIMVQEAIIRDLQKKDGDLISTLEGPDLLSSDPTRKFIRQIFGATAEYEKDMIVAKLRAARQRKKAAEGKCEGRKGYSDTGKNILGEIKKLRRKRGNRKRMTYANIARDLNDRGFATLDGKSFTGANVAMILKRAKS